MSVRCGTRVPACVDRERRVPPAVSVSRLAQVEREGRITHVSNPAYLIASHITPWRHATNVERLSAHNGLLLAPQADFLFDRGL